MEYMMKMGVFKVVDEKECYDNACKTLMLKWADKMKCEKRFGTKQTGHIGFGANDKKELKILNRTIKIDVLKDEMTLEADTKLVENVVVECCERR